MRLTALLLAATASAALVTVASAQTTGQTNTTTTSTTTTQTAPAGQAVNPPAASVGTPPVQEPATTTGATAAVGMTPATGGAFRPITPASGADIVAVLQASGQFTTLLKIADATNLTSTLKTAPNLTVLAPTDAAFAALPPSALDLKDPANLQKLQALLTYHVINAKVPPLKGHSATPITTVANKPVTLDGSGEMVKINDATALQSQVQASNGVIYPIDKVLSPDYVPPPAAAASATDDTATTKSTTTTKKSSKKKH